MAFENLSKREKIMLLALMGLVIIFITYMYLYTPLVEGVADREANIEDLEQEIIQKRVEAEEKQRLEKEYELLLEQSGEMTEEQFFTEDKEFQLIQKLNSLADDLDVELFNINSQNLVLRERIYIEIPISLSIKGSYNQIINYLGELEHSKYAIRIESFSSVSDFVASRDDEEKLEARVDLIGYGRKEVENL